MLWVFLPELLLNVGACKMVTLSLIIYLHNYSWDINYTCEKDNISGSCLFFFCDLGGIFYISGKMQINHFWLRINQCQEHGIFELFIRPFFRSIL